MAVLNNTGIRAGASGAGGGDAYQIEKSLRFNEADSAYLTRTVSSTGSTTSYTWSGWVKRNDVGAGSKYFLSSINSTMIDLVYLVAYKFKGYPTSVRGDAVLRDPSTWYHLVCAVDTTQSTDSDRIKLYINGEVVTDFDDERYPAEDRVLGINQSGGVVKIGQYSTTDGSDFQLAEVHYIDGEQLTASDFGETNATTGQWIPKDCSEDLTYGTNGFYLKFNNTSDLGEDSSGNDNHFTANNLEGVTVPTIPNISADTFSDDITYYSNGSGLSDAATLMFDGGNTVDNYCYAGTSNTANHITWTPATSIPDTAHNGYIWVCGGNGNGLGLDDMNVYINGSGSPSTNTDEIDQSGGSHHWNNWYKYAVSGTFTSVKVEGIYTLVRGVSFKETPSTSGTHMVDGEAHITQGVDTVDVDVSTDTPTPFDDEGNGTGNYATLNSLHKGTNATLSQGNLQLVNTTTWGTTISTIGMSSGKWYAEVTLSGTIGYPAFGVSSIDGAPVTSYLGQDADSYVWFAYSTAGLYTAADYTDQTGDWVVDCVAGDVIGLALDMENGTLKYYKNGTLLDGGNAFTGITGTQFFATCGYSQTEDWNFGARPFAYTNAGVDRPAADYLALNVFNLDATEITSGEYEGNGSDNGPVVWMNATPATLRISSTNDPPQAGDAVTFDPDDVDPLAGGFKIRNASTNNGSGTTYYWSAPTTESAFKYANAQSNE